MYINRNQPSNVDIGNRSHTNLVCTQNVNMCREQLSVQYVHVKIAAECAMSPFSSGSGL